LERFTYTSTSRRLLDFMATELSERDAASVNEERWR
jgi:hypothetical protein